MTYPTRPVFDTSGADARANRAESAVQALETRLDRAMMTVEAMWTIMRDKLGVTNEELVERIVDLDLTDGILDGKERKPPLECPSCSRRISRRFPRCMYCGVEIQHDPFA